MKSFFLSFFIFIGVLYGTSTVKKIENSKKNLSVTSSAKKETSKQIGKIAKEIQSAEKDIIYLEKKINTLESDQEKSEKKYESLKEELNKSENELAQTSRSLEAKRKKFISLLSEQFSIVFAMEHSHEPTEKSILTQEVYKVYKKHNSESLKTLKSDIITLKKLKNDKIYLRNKAKNKIKGIIKKREDYAQKKLEKEKLLKTLAENEEKYNAKLEKIEDKQNSLRATLAKLNILHEKEVEAARKAAAARKEAMRLEKERQRRIREKKALARKKARQAKEALRTAKTKEDKEAAQLASQEAEKEERKVYTESEQVRQVNSSYEKSQTYAYRGEKTISPLKNAKVVKKYGTYIDPIYKIKIFNESVTLQASSSNTKVKNVLNGKVVFAGKSSMLGQVVVVSHSKKIHTVYAGLSKIAPTIHVGSKIKRGYVVGKVNQKLIFQATKDSKHMDPLKLIKI